MGNLFQRLGKRLAQLSLVAILGGFTGGCEPFVTTSFVYPSFYSPVTSSEVYFVNPSPSYSYVRPFSSSFFISPPVYFHPRHFEPPKPDFRHDPRFDPKFDSRFEHKPDFKPDFKSAPPKSYKVQQGNKTTIIPSPFNKR